MKKQLLLILMVMTGFQFFAEAQSNQYLHLDRQDDYVRLDNGSQYIANAPGITMAGWFYTDELAYGQGMLGFRGSQGFYFIQLDDGVLECRLETNTGLHEYVAPAFTVLPGTWQHFAWTYNGLSVALYVDGVLQGSSPASGTFSATDIAFTVGRSILSNLNFYYGGRVDEVTVWSEALSASDIMDIMETEPTGTEENLELYYKFNQGEPGGDNTGISQAISEVEGGTRDADLIGFAMTGETSNFGGELQTGFQAISFTDIPNKLNTAADFQLDAEASSGLGVDFTVNSGPASVSGNTITLDGNPGEVVITASQPGNAEWDPAAEITKSFWVVDPQETTPNTDIRSPLAGEVYLPELIPIQLAAIVNTDFTDLLSVSSVQFEVDGELIPAKDWNNEHYTGWWAPSAYGNYNIAITAFNNFGASSVTIVNIDVVETVDNMEADAFSEIWINTTNFEETVEATLPSFQAAFDQVTAELVISCPPGGCGEWDRVAWIDAKTHEGNWYEFIHYITPYSTACTHSIDVTDFVSSLTGKISFRVGCETFDNGYEYSLKIKYQAGTPDYKYSSITPAWHDHFDFGNPNDLQPVPSRTLTFPENTAASKFKLIGSGHGWGDNNTSNAAEFFETTHHLHVDGAETFTQHNWLTCNPNPDNCSPQNGTWFYDRAGFCPGAISPWFDYDLDPYIANGSIVLDYVFDENYVDMCHVNNPDCVSGVTCNDCNDGFNPHLIVASSFINYSDAPIDILSNTSPVEVADKNSFQLFPNPSNGAIDLLTTKALVDARIAVLNSVGVKVLEFENVRLEDKHHHLNLSHLASGVYIVVVQSNDETMSRILNLSK